MSAASSPCSPGGSLGGEAEQLERFTPAVIEFALAPYLGSTRPAGWPPGIPSGVRPTRPPAAEPHQGQLQEVAQLGSLDVLALQPAQDRSLEEEEPALYGGFECRRRAVSAGASSQVAECVDNRVHALFGGRSRTLPGCRGRRRRGCARSPCRRPRAPRRSRGSASRLAPSCSAGGRLRSGAVSSASSLLTALQCRQDEVLLGREVVVEQPLGDAGRGGDLLDRDLVVGASSQQLVAGAEQLLAP